MRITQVNDALGKNCTISMIKNNVLDRMNGTGINNKICVFFNFAFYGFEGIRRKLGIYDRGLLEGFYFILLFCRIFKGSTPLRMAKKVNV